jgi:hypothetical protein
MRTLMIIMILFISNLAFAQVPELDDISKSDLKKVSTEFAANFAHTTVSAPHTKGIFGFEVGVIGGLSKTPKLQNLVDDSGGTGSDFKNMPHAGLIGRVHIPFQLFLELSVLPEFSVSDVTVSNKTIGVGWNLGRFVGWPFDLSFAVEGSRSNISYEQVINNASTSNANVDADISFESTTKTYWVGASKRFLFITPYVKAGGASMESDVDIDASVGTIFNSSFSSSQKASSKNSGGYFAMGANLHLFFMNLGFEASRIMNVGRATAKLSFEF